MGPAVADGRRLSTPESGRYHPRMERARKHQRLFSALAFGLLALVAELVGRSLTHRLDFGSHVRSPSYAGADYYPFLLIAVKAGIALMLARLVWRVVKARAAERAAHRLLAAVGSRPARRAPKLRVTLSPRLWLAFFALTSVIYLVQSGSEQAADGRLSLLAPWLHSSALPSFAVLAVFCALGWSLVQRWLADYEEYAQETVAHALRVAGAAALESRRPALEVASPPRSRFGLSFESRPPPLPA